MLQLVRGQTWYDEISHFQDARLISATDALWRLFQFKIIARALTVVQLDVHLENGHTLYFREYRRPWSMQNEMPEISRKYGLKEIKSDRERLILGALTSRFFTWTSTTKSWTFLAKPRSLPCTAPANHMSQFSIEEYDFFERAQGSSELYIS